jgi:hypothetical protein
VIPRRSSPTPALAPILGVGVISAFRTTLTAAALDALALGDGLGDGVLLPVAVMLGEGSTVGPGDTDSGGRPIDGVVPTRTTRADGTPCAPETPGEEDELAAGAPDAVGPGVAGAFVTTAGGDAMGDWPLLGARALYASSTAPAPASA